MKGFTQPTTFQAQFNHCADYNNLSLIIICIMNGIRHRSEYNSVTLLCPAHRSVGFDGKRIISGDEKGWVASACTLHSIMGLNQSVFSVIVLYTNLQINKINHGIPMQIVHMQKQILEGTISTLHLVGSKVFMATCVYLGHSIK